MSIDELVRRKNKLVDELMLEIDGCLRRFHEDTGASVRSIDVELMDVTPIGPEARSRVHVIQRVDVEIDI